MGIGVLYDLQPLPSQALATNNHIYKFCMCMGSRMKYYNICVLLYVYVVVVCRMLDDIRIYSKKAQAGPYA